MPDFSLQTPPGADTATPGNPPANPTPGPEVNQNHSWQVSQVTWAGCAVNFGLAILKGAGGLVAGSNALIADAVHTLTDLASDAIVLVGVRYWSQPADGEHPHGHGRIETIITLTIGIILAGVGVGLAFDSVAALAKGITTPTDGNLLPGPAVLVALLIALAAIFAKEILYRWTVAWGRRIRSSALVANAWHHRTDALSSIPPTLTLAAREIGIWDSRDIWYLDNLGAIVVCVMLFYAAWEVISPCLHFLVDAGVDQKTRREMLQIILATPGVITTHKLRSRYLGPAAVAADMHIMVDGSISVTDGHAIAARVKYRLLDSQLPLVDVVVHIEPASNTGSSRHARRPGDTESQEKPHSAN